MNKQRHVVGWAWIGDILLPIYSKCELRKGKNKGKFFVEYLNGWSTERKAFRYKKEMVIKSDIQADLSPSLEEQQLKKAERKVLLTAKELKP